jgi:diguanylate cyclase (GGDEF)-like protein/PAS domain S-box-containing protein
VVNADKLGIFARYRKIILAVVVFMVADSLVIGINFYSTYKANESAVSINLSGRQRMLSQRMTKVLLLLQRAVIEEDGAGIERDLKELDLTVGLFDATLKGFRDGGMVTGGDGDPVHLTQVDTEASRKFVSDAYVIWNPYLEHLRPFLGNQRAFSAWQLETVVGYARANNLELLRLMNDLTTDLEMVASERARTLRIVLIVGILVAFGNFAYTVIVSIRDLMASDEKIAKAQRETREVLSTVHKSIFGSLNTFDAGSNDILAIPRGHETDELGCLVKDMNELLFRLRSSLEHEHELHFQHLLNEKLKLYAAMFENIQEGVIITDRRNRIIAVNRAFTQITGYAESEVLQKNPRFMYSDRDDRDFYKKMWKELISLGHWKGELWNHCKNGQIKPEWHSISVVRNDDGEIANHIAIFSDVSERKKAEERIEFLAHHDPLTLLPNRILTRNRFSVALTAAMQEKSSVAMLYIDLDNFKFVNDTFGHQVGDQLLLSVTERLKSRVRESDTISREGGDEFMVILPGIRDINIVHRITRGILVKLSMPFEIQDQLIGISASIGVACYPQHGNNFDILRKNADTAMYTAKKSGKNAYRVFADEMNVDVLDKLKLRAHLSNAFQNNEFHIVFQAQVDITTDRLIGAEVLCRWTHPEMGPVSPGRFIGLAEESGLINQLGKWVLEQACTQGKRWLDSGIPPFTIAVNVSSQQFNHSNLVTTVQKILEESAFPAQYLELEFTESGLLDNVERSIDTIGKLKTLGIKLSIDDFGTGYSSLAYLKQFKVEKLKIDQSFVRDIDDSEDLGIVRAVIQMGKTLQLEVIAEGVETEKQMKILKDMGCHEIQGYLISKPLPPAEFEQFVVSWNTRHALPEA